VFEENGPIAWKIDSPSLATKEFQWHQGYHGHQQAIHHTAESQRKKK
jgi:hypothetical protein